MVLSAIV